MIIYDRPNVVQLDTKVTDITLSGGHQAQSVKKVL